MLRASFKLIYRLIPPCFFLFFTCLLYSGTLGTVFHFDDINYIINAPHLRTPSVLFQSLFSNFFIPGRELTALSFAFNHHFHELDVTGYHIVNIFLHILTGYILYLILDQLLRLKDTGKSSLIATCATLLFLSHPVAVNSVTYIAQRHVLLATLFYFLGYFCFLKWRYGKSTKNQNTLWAITALMAYWAAIHSKSMAITLPVVCMFTVLVFSSDKRIELRRNLKFASIFLFIFILGTLVYANFDGLFIQKAGTAGFRTENLWNPWTHLLTESVVFIQYWKILLIPWTGWLNVDHHFQLADSLSEPRVIISMAAHLIILSGALLAAYKRYFIASIGVLWFYIVLSPYLFVPILDVMVEYKTYPAFPAVLFIAVDLVRRVKSQKAQYILFSTFLIVLLFFCHGTIERNKVMETEQSFWSDSIRKDPNNYRAHNNLGLAYHKQGRPDLALIEYRKALKILPGYLFAIANAGDSLLKTGKNREALILYKIVIDNNPEKASTYFKAGTASGNLKLWPDALVYFEKAIKLDPYYVAAWHNLGLTKGHLGMWKESKLAFERIIRFKPNHFEAHSNLGVVFLRLNENDRAGKAFEKSVAIEPSFAEGHYKLSLFYASEGKQKEAIQELEILRKLDTSLAKKIEEILLK